MKADIIARVLRALAACKDRVIADHARGIIIRLATEDIDVELD